MSTDFHARVELATRDTAETVLARLGPALAATGHTALGWVELHLILSAEGLGAAALLAVSRVEAAAPGVAVLAVEVLTSDEAAARAGIVPSPTTIGVPAAAELLGITEQAVRHKLRTGRLAGRREGRDWRIQRAEVDRARAARDANP